MGTPPNEVRLNILRIERLNQSPALRIRELTQLYFNCSRAYLGIPNHSIGLIMLAIEQQATLQAMEEQRKEQTK